MWTFGPPVEEVKYGSNQVDSLRRRLAEPERDPTEQTGFHHDYEFLESILGGIRRPSPGHGGDSSEPLSEPDHRWEKIDLRRCSTVLVTSTPPTAVREPTSRQSNDHGVGGAGSEC